MLWHQVYSVLILAAVAWTAAGIGRHVAENPVVTFLLSGAIYTLVALDVVIALPSMLGMTRGELQAHIARGVARLSGRKNG